MWVHLLQPHHQVQQIRRSFFPPLKLVRHCLFRDKSVITFALVAVLSFPTIAVIRTIQTAYGQCTETASVTLSAAAGWSVTEETSNQVTVSYFGPKAYVSYFNSLLSICIFMLVLFA